MDKSDDEWLDEVKAFVLPVDLFQAGFISTRHAVWQKYFDQTGWTTKARHIVGWLTKGLSITFVPIDAECQTKHPRFEERLKLVRNLLEKNVGRAAVQELLMGSQPHQVHFKNRISVKQHIEFVVDTIQQLLQHGVIKPWQQTTPMIVINGLGVAVDRRGKRRLVLDARYVNLWVAYEAFSYEKLADVKGYLQLKTL